MTSDDGRDPFGGPDPGPYDPPPAPPGPPPGYGRPPGPPPGYGRPPGPPPGYGRPPGPPPGYGQPPGPPPDWWSGQQPPQPHGQQPYQPYGQPCQPYGQPARPPKAPMSGGSRVLGWILLALAALVAVGSVTTWVTFGDLSVTGLGSYATSDDSLQRVVDRLNERSDVKDGWFTLVLAVVAGGFAVARGLGRLALSSAITILCLAVLVVLVALIDLGDISSNEDYQLGGVVPGMDDATAGWGLYVVLLAGLVAIPFAIAAIVRRR